MLKYFSSFREMMRADHEAAEAERKAIDEKARTDHKAAITKKLGLVTEAFELQLQLIMENLNKCPEATHKGNTNGCNSPT